LNIQYPVSVNSGIRISEDISEDSSIHSYRVFLLSFLSDYLIVIHLVCLLEAFSLVDGGTYHLTVANYRMLIVWQIVFFGHD